MEHENNVVKQTEERNEYIDSLKIIANTLMSSISSLIEFHQLDAANEALMVLQNVAKNIKEFESIKK